MGSGAGLQHVPCALSPGRGEPRGPAPSLPWRWPCSLQGPPGVTTQGPWVPARRVGVGRGLSVESQALSAHPRAACLVRTHAGQPGKPGAAPGSLSPEQAYRRCASRPRVLEDDLSAVGVADCRPGSGLCWVYHELCRRIPVRSVQFALFPNFSTARTRPRGPGSPECRPSPCLLPGSQRGCWSPLTHKPWVPEPYWRIEGTRVDHRRIPWFSTRWFCNPPGDAGQCLKTLGTWKLGRG